MQQTWALCTWAQIITKKEKKERKKNASHKHIILKILILFVPDETVVDSNLQNCSKCVFSCCSKCVFAARVLLCADVTFQQVAKTQERRQRISGDVWRRQWKRTASQGQRTTSQWCNATEMQRNSECSFFLLPEKSDTNFPIPPSKRSRQRGFSPLLLPQLHSHSPRDQRLANARQTLTDSEGFFEEALGLGDGRGLLLRQEHVGCRAAAHATHWRTQKDACLTIPPRSFVVGWENKIRHYLFFYLKHMTHSWLISMAW